MTPADSTPIDASVLDLDSYDLPGLRADIHEILDLPNAIQAVVKKSSLAIFLGAALAWIAFRPRMPLWALVPYIAVIVLALVIAAAAVSAFLVLKSRIEATDRAADRTLFTVAAMHGDLLNARASGSELPLREVATFLTHTLVFPLLLGSAGSMLETAATSATPVGWFAGRIMKRAIAEVENRLLAALNEIDEAQTETTLVELQDGVAADPWAELPVHELPNQIRSFYEGAHRYLSRMVDGLEVLSIGGAGLTTAIAVLPLVMVLSVGLVVT